MAISVIIPVYNCEKWLASCLESVLQFDIVHKIVIVDDGSTDGSKKLIREYAGRDSRIVSLYHDGGLNKGRSASRNLGIKHASEDWIAFLDADDYYLSNRFDGFDANADVDGFYGIIGSESNISHLHMEQVGLKRTVDSSDLYKHLTEESESYFSIISLTVRKEALESIGGFDEELAVGEDTDLIWRLAHQRRLTSLLGSEPVAIRRIHGHNVDRDSKERSAFYKKWLKRSPYPVTKRAQKRLFYAAMEYQEHRTNRSWLQKKLLYFLWRLTSQTGI